jgi:L-threonylcarbamoyladenylate synthase
MTDAANKLQTNGAVGVIPTDTIYGVVARANDKEAVSRLYESKARENKPGTIIAANINQLVELGIKRRYLTAVADYWPGPVSVIIPCSSDELNYLHLGANGLAVRIPDDKKLSELLSLTGPLLTTSANLPGQPPASKLAEAKEYFGKNMDFYIDGGDLSNNLPSTIIRIVDDVVEVIRIGAVKINL